MNTEQLSECIQAETGIASLRSALNPALTDTRAILRLVLKSRADLQNCYTKSKELVLAGKAIESNGVQLTSIEEIHARYLDRLAELEGFERLALLPTFSEAAGGSLDKHECKPDACTPEFLKSAVLDSLLCDRLARIISDRRTIEKHVNCRSATAPKGYDIRFKDKPTAEWAIGNTLAFYEPLVSQWLLKSILHFKILWHFFCLHLPIFDFSIPIGEMIMPGSRSHTVMSVKVVLVRHPMAPKGFFVKTAFPTMPLEAAKGRFDNLDVFCSYFVPGWEADFETMDGAVDFFALASSANAKRGLVAEIASFLNSYSTEDVLSRELLKRGCYYDPHQFSRKYSEWLNSVKAAVEARLPRDDSAVSIVRERNTDSSPLLSIASILIEALRPGIKNLLELWLQHKEIEAAEKKLRELTWKQVTHDQRKVFDNMLALLAADEPEAFDFILDFLRDISEHQKAQLVVQLIHEDAVSGAKNLSNVISMLKGIRGHSARIDLLASLRLLR